MYEPTAECPAWISAPDEAMADLFRQVVADCIAHDRRMRQKPRDWGPPPSRISISDRH
nr:hypothetical protein [uncultured Mediterranean phage uvMED]